MEFPENSGSTLTSRAFKSLEEFRTLQELPGSKPLAIISVSGVIMYATHSFFEHFGVSESGSISDLPSEPPLDQFISGLVKSKYRAIQVDIMAGLDLQSDFSGYMVDLERIMIGEEEFVLLLFSSSAERRIFENRINTLHMALDYGNIPVLLTDKSGAITYATRSFEQILNKKIEELYRHPLPEMLAEMVPEEDNELLREALAQELPWSCLISGYDPHGVLWYQELKMMPVLQELNELNHFVVTAHDITQHVQKNLMVRQSEERQRSIINNISDMLLIIKRFEDELTVDNANDNFLEWVGLSKLDAIGKHAESIVQPELYGIILEATPEFSESGKSQQTVSYFDKIRQRRFIVKITYTDDIHENVRYYIIALTDITEQIEHEERLRKAYEKETQLNKLKSAFLANMSHEIRTPSMAIIGYANLLCDDIMSGYFDSVQEMTGYLKDGVKRMLKLIDNIVEVSMIESEDYNFQFDTHNFNELVEASFQELLPLANDRSITMHVDFDDEIGQIITDESKVRKIIEAVVDNAIKYNFPNGRVVIKTIGSPDSATVYVSDTGRGIDEDKIDRILEPFVQEEDEGHKRRYEGAGLGLTIAYRLTKALKGELRVKSKPGEGATVIIKFPLQQ
jgi:PAS domain S-box-containing protein